MTQAPVTQGDIQPWAKLLDFGLAKMTLSGDEDETARTIDGAVLGTAPYMSPEQAQGKQLDERSDIFSFGAVLYEMVSESAPLGAVPLRMCSAP